VRYIFRLSFLTLSDRTIQRYRTKYNKRTDES